MPYAPVLVKIEHPGLKEIYNNYSYLLQVWKDGIKTFEKPLRSNILYKLIHFTDQINFWSCNYDYLIFKTSEDDDDSDYL